MVENIPLLLSTQPLQEVQNVTRRVKHNRSWKNGEIETLIGLYEERVCLWDFGSEEYINQHGKDLAYEQLDEEMKYNIGREEYKSKWTRLRGQFIRQKDGERKKKIWPGEQWSLHIKMKVVSASKI